MRRGPSDADQREKDPDRPGQEPTEGNPGRAVPSESRGHPEDPENRGPQVDGATDE